MTKLQMQRLGAVCLIGWSIANAQTLPDAGSTRQQLESSPNISLPNKVKPSTQVALPPAAKSFNGLSVHVKAWNFSGNTLLSKEQLDAALASYVGKDLDFSAIKLAADAIAAVYRESGWVVRVYLPEQDVHDGIITLQLIEARFGGVRIEGEPSKRVLSSDIQAYFQQGQKIGEPINANALDRALLLSDDLPGVNVSGILVQGQNEGETAVALQTADEPLVTGDVVLDNVGARSTGRNRIAVNMNINSPSNQGELVSLTALHTQGSDYMRGSLSAPVGYNGMRLGVNASHMSFKVVDGPSDLQSLNIKGSSESLGLDLSFPVMRERMSNLYLLGGYENKHFYNDNVNKSSDPKTYADYGSNNLRLGISGNSFDYLGGGGSNSGSLQLLRGRLDEMKAHTQLDNIDRSYNKLNYTLSRLQKITAEHSLFASFQGQYATQFLDSSEKFYVGGPSSVRAYPTSELGGDRGHVLTGEWRWKFDSNWVLSAFIDQALVVAIPATSADTKSSSRLRGHGLSAGWQNEDGFSAKVTWSHREGSNPKPSSNGTDGDGTLLKNRIWLTTSLSF